MREKSGKVRDKGAGLHRRHFRFLGGDRPPTLCTGSHCKSREGIESALPPGLPSVVPGICAQSQNTDFTRVISLYRAHAPRWPGIKKLLIGPSGLSYDCSVEKSPEYVEGEHRPNITPAVT